MAKRKGNLTLFRPEGSLETPVNFSSIALGAFELTL